jgi:hypothetical protein
LLVEFRLEENLVVEFFLDDIHFFAFIHFFNNFVVEFWGLEFGFVAVHVIVRMVE